MNQRRCMRWKPFPRMVRRFAWAFGQRGRIRISRGLLGLMVVSGTIVMGSCGKRGAPLPPLKQVPVQPSSWGFRIAGPESFIWFLVPESNIDGSRPARVEWIYLFPGDLKEPVEKSQAVQTWRFSEGTLFDKPTRALLPWQPKPGCYSLALANHHRKWASLTSRICLEDISKEELKPKAELRLVEKGLELYGEGIGKPVEIYRLDTTNNEVKEYSTGVTAWPWDALKTVEPSVGPWHWEDHSVELGHQYVYMLRYRIKDENQVHVSSSGVVVGPVVFQDVFPPPAPDTVEFRETEAGLELSWTPVWVEDLKGYVLDYRLEPNSDWQPFLSEPVVIARTVIPPMKLDELAQSGARWIEFRVRSVDNKNPPNISAEGPIVRYENPKVQRKTGGQT